MKIAVLCGGISPERNVSLAGGKAVYSALKGLGYDVIAVDPARGTDSIIDIESITPPETSPAIEELNQFPDRNLIDCINSNIFDDVDCAFLVLHGQNGEDGKVQSLLQLRGIRYTGSGIKSSALAIDKLSSKLMFIATGISTPPWSVVRSGQYDDFDHFKEIRNELGPNLVVKPNDQGSTIGITIIDTGNLDDIHDAVLIASKYSKSIVIEEFISGREITVGVLDGEALPIIEIVTDDGFYDYGHKYSKGYTDYICPAEISPDIADFTLNLAQTAYNVLGCSGFSRVDFRLSEDGVPFCLEVNTIPGFTSTSLVPMAAKEVGIEFPELCEKIINMVMESDIY